MAPYADILSYCLMPNHFHFLIYPNEKAIMQSSVTTGFTQMSNFSYGVKVLLSSYAKAINKQENRVGSLFTQNTVCKQVSSESSLEDYALWCFYYIHCNPVKAKLVEKMKDWEFSSFQDYIHLRKDDFCNKTLTKQLLSLDINTWLLEENNLFPDNFDFE